MWGSRRSLRCALWVLLALSGAGPGASALSIQDVTPLWFDGPDGYGFDPAAVAAAGKSALYLADPGDRWIDAGAGRLALPIAIRTDLGPIHKNPHAKGRRPTRERPFIADSTWTLTNHTGALLEDALLVFTLGDARGKRRPPVALDGELIEILHYSFQGTEYLFGAVRLPDLAAEGPGSSTEIRVRYIVGGALDRGGRRRLLMPPLGVSAVTGFAVVPEPSTLALVAAGLAGLGLSARRRRSA
jgi:hypothetical protein